MLTMLNFQTTVKKSQQDEIQYSHQHTRLTTDGIYRLLSSLSAATKNLSFKT